MPNISVNVFALGGAALVKMALGALWYSPALFLKPWLSLTRTTEEQMKERMAQALAVDILGSFVMAFVLVHAIRYAGAVTAPQGMAVAFWNWLGFVAVSTIGTVTFERKPFKLFLLNNGYTLLSLLMMGAILAVWG